MVLGIHKDPVPGLRKKYDRLREKADKIKNRQFKGQLLKYLDQLEPTIIALEEQEQPRFERRRMIRYVKDGIESVGDMLAEKNPPQQQQQQPSQYQGR